MKLLEGIRVLDFGRFIAGPYCATLLGDLGADVIRVERIEGGEDRCLPPVMSTGEGGLFLQVNRNKRGLTLDLAHDAGRDIVRQLIQSADVVIANLPRPTLRQLGLDWDSVQALNPRAVLVTVNTYGNTGPLADGVGFDGIGQAMSGAMFLTGTPDEPRRAVNTWVDYSTAQACAMGALAALMARDRADAREAGSGRGQLVEGSLLKSAVIQTNGLLIEQAVRERNRVPQGNRGFSAAPSDVFKTKTGWILVQTIGQSMFDRACDLIGRPDMKSDPRFLNDDLRGANSADISAAMAAWAAQHTREEALAALARAKLPAGPVLSPQDALEDPQIAAAGLLVARQFEGRPGEPEDFPLAPHPVDLRGPDAESTVSTVYRHAAPRLGQHTEDILLELGYSAASISALRRQKVI
jgi:crotonobetainyl-CoA:carnitine CoA-transferase CaiB-like acyl-CoA transferase